MIGNGRFSAAGMPGWAFHAIGAAVFVIGMIVFFAAVYAPFATAEANDRVKLAALERIAAKENELHREHESLRKLLLQKEKETNWDRIPDGPEEAKLQNQVADAAKTCGVQIKNYHRDKVTVREHWSELTVVIACSGDYEAICRFLDGLERCPRVSRFASMQIKVNEESGDCALDVKLISYFGLE